MIEEQNIPKQISSQSNTEAKKRLIRIIRLLLVIVSFPLYMRFAPQDYQAAMHPIVAVFGGMPASNIFEQILFTISPFIMFIWIIAIMYCIAKLK